jgi:poly(3-hydroxybutyrate) depolymerase/predicted deacylase
MGFERRWRAWLRLFTPLLLLIAGPGHAADAGGWGDCDLGDLRIEADFPGARADACHRKAPDEVAVLIKPEAGDIIPAAWYAFRVIAKHERELTVQLVYGTAGHRYRPKVSDDGTAWRYLEDERVEVAPDGSAILRLQVGPQPLWVAGQELWPSSRYSAWLDRMGGRPGVTTARLGWSAQRRPIGMLQTDVGATRPQTVVFVGRQHPPEVPGAFAFQAFVETVLDDSDLSRRFRASHRVIAIPELNPDGVEMGHWRYNAAGVDINRDWGPFTQPETRLVRDLLASIERDPATRLALFLDFHATAQDVFYTQTDEQAVTPPLFEKRWLGRLQERMPDYAVNRSPVYRAGNPTAKTWVFESYGVPSATFETGRETPRDLVGRLGTEAARAMMETLLGDADSGTATTANGAMLAAGDGSFRFDSWAGPPLKVWYHTPAVVTANTPVLFVMHGVQRDADRYRNEWSALAEERGFILVAPEFDERQFPGARSYNLGNVLEGTGQPVPKERWSFSAIEPLFEVVRQMTGTRVTRYGLYGHSAGAQFVHRYLMFVPDARVGTAVAANAGWYTMPEQTVAFPYGLRGSGVTDTALRAALQRPLTILLGTADSDPNYPNLRRTPEAMKQGPHRLARGEAFVEAAAVAAAAANLKLAWKLERVEGVAHDNAGMAPRAAALFAAGAR